MNGAAPSQRILEVACDLVEDAVKLPSLGVNRIEMCSQLTVGGLTPSPGVVKAIRASIPVQLFALIRIRDGDFRYTPLEVEAMERDIEILADCGVDGFVVAALEGDHFDCTAMERWRNAAPNLPFASHRAIDEVQDLEKAVEDLFNLGYCRTLASGGRGKAFEDADKLEALRKLAHGKVEIMAGGGIRAGGLHEFKSIFGGHSIHIGPREKAKAQQNEAYPRSPSIDLEAVRAVRQLWMD